MINGLTIQGMAIIDRLEIQFSEGFNVITGETGAGKSILIKALSFLLGGKATTDLVRKNHEQAMVVGHFTLPANHEAGLWLQNLGVEWDSDDEISLMIRRQVNLKGKSLAFVNDIPVTGQSLKELGGLLIDIFGQHDNQKLLKSTHHLRYLDSFLVENPLLGEVSRLRRACDELVGAVIRILENQRQAGRDADYTRFRLEELEKFEPSEADYSKCISTCENAETGIELRTGLQEILTYLEPEGASLSSGLWEAGRRAGRLALKLENEEIQSLGARLEKAAADVDEVNYALTGLLGQVDLDEETLENAQKRVFGYQELFRKFGVKTVDELLGERSRLEEEGLSRETAARRVEEKLCELNVLAEKLKQTAESLGRARMKVANQVKKSVVKELQELAMAGASFDVKFRNVELPRRDLDFSALQNGKLASLWSEAESILSQVSLDGMENAEFLLASNPGEPALPLAKIASGGELSRIMLALKKALVADAETCVLVFDEIDTGISGRVADVVGRKMQELADGFQVICISHLPQVAVYADSHFLVQKRASKEKGEGVRTESTLIRLSKEESAQEIARLLSGEEVSSTSLANAKALIQKARKKKSGGDARV